MATDATGTPTSLGIPKYNTSVDAPSGLGFNATMDAINTIIDGYVPEPASIASGEVPVWNGTAWVRSSVTGVSRASLATTTRKAGLTAIQVAELGYAPDGFITAWNWTIPVPDDYVSGDLSFRTLMRSDAASNNVRMSRNVIRHRDGVVVVGIDSGVATTVGMPGTALMDTQSYTFAVSAAQFAAGDGLSFGVSRLGTDVADTHTGNLFLSAVWIEYLGRV